MDVQGIFVAILNAVSDFVGTLLGVLPNPDPFPALLDGLELGQGDVLAVAYYWLDTFFIADGVISVVGSWLALFPLAWVIQALWRWAKVR